MKRFDVSAEAIDAIALRTALHRPDSGGFCCFEGWVRDHNDGRAVDGLEYQVYVELALREGERIVAEAIGRFGIADARCVHRSGDLKVGDMAVWVGVASGHRGEAFAACRYIIDEVKHRLPVWKKERYLDGDSAWVACSHDDGPHHGHGGDEPHRHRHDVAV